MSKKYDLELPEPFGLKLEIVDIEDRLPSVQCYVNFLLGINNVSFSYSATTWFECSMYDEFVKQLKNIQTGKNTEAKFYNMGCEIGYFVDSKQFSLYLYESHGIKGSAIMELRRDFDRDLLAQHIRNLDNFPKWW